VGSENTPLLPQRVKSGSVSGLALLFVEPCPLGLQTVFSTHCPSQSLNIQLFISLELFSCVWEIAEWMERERVLGIFAMRVFDACLFFEACSHSIFSLSGDFS
jgi:hypothetical protein